MKNVISLAVLVFSMNMLLAQTTPMKDNSVPNSVNQQFNTDYPNVSADWTVDGENNYIAEFKNSTTKTPSIVVYDKQGKRIRTESEMAAKTYPTAIDDYYGIQHPNQMYKVWSSKDARGNTTYYIKHKGDVHWFDKDGKFTTSKPESTAQKVKPMK